MYMEKQYVLWQLVSADSSKTQGGNPSAMERW
jgi:hypothetical protein